MLMSFVATSCRTNDFYACMNRNEDFFFGEKKPRQMTKSFFEISARFLESIACKKKYFVLHCHYVHARSPFILQITFFHVAHSDWSWQKQTFWGYRKSVAHFFCSSSCDQRGFVRSCLHVRDRHKVAPNNSCSTDSCIDRNQVTSTVWVFYKNYMKKVFYNFTDLLHLIFQSVV